MPRRRDVRPWIFVAVLAGAGAFAHPARASEPSTCVAAAEKAQELRNAGKLTESREQLVICGRPGCPKLIQTDCTKWMTEVQAMLPSIVPGAKDHHGRDLVDVKVSIDGEVLTETLDGRPLSIDPGVYTVRFETEGAPAVEEQLVVRQGEQNRVVTISFPAPKNADPWEGGDSSARKENAPPVAAYVSGGVGLVALGAALYIGLDANGDVHSMRDTCAPRCADSDVDDVRTRRVAAGVTAAIGGAALVAGVVLYFIQRSGSKSTALDVLPGIVSAGRSRGPGVGAGFRF